ncbi:helix-turn-helix transcriptional regulator [Clostridium sp. D2Q-14]|uniref:helix-turn-helix domain-containing protein n=1 Tax=Anaeromonas gelatinilytica TaxID=2683194 RepID=UPI00193BEB55|nr:helix-turn-helix transcriptional regulator [Anaeromonas gelatinilytica]MBS4535169.1 helix-turn-helix transcriptional regulator [Anaeromonas gelatinilytica]
MIGENIKHNRLKLGLTQSELAEKINKTSTLITKIETNKANPSIDTLMKIAKALGVTIAELLDEKSA